MPRASALQGPVAGTGRSRAAGVQGVSEGSSATTAAIPRSSDTHGSPVNSSSPPATAHQMAPMIATTIASARAQPTYRAKRPGARGSGGSGGSRGVTGTGVSTCGLSRSFGISPPLISLSLSLPIAGSTRGPRTDLAQVRVRHTKSPTGRNPSADRIPASAPLFGNVDRRKFALRTLPRKRERSLQAD